MTVYNQDGTIQRVEFGIEQLQVVDLVRRWGRPDEVRRTRRQYIRVWWGAGLTATAPLGRLFLYQLPLDSVVLFGAS